MTDYPDLSAYLDGFVDYLESSGIADAFMMILPLILAFVSLGAFELGSRVRNRVHVVMPYKDPITLFLFGLCLSPVISSAFGYTILDPANIWYIAFVISFLSCYSLAYMRGELNMVYVNVHTIISDRFPNGAQDVKPIVFYWDRDGKQCVQEQSFGAILKTVVFGIHSPLRLDTGMIRRTRPIFVQKILYPKVAVDAIDVVEEEITDVVVKKWIFKFKTRSYRYVPAPSCIDNTQQWLVSAYNQENLTRELTRKEAQLLEAKTTAVSSFYARSSDLLVELINDRTPGSEVYEDVIRRLAPEPDMMTVKMKEQPADLPTENRKKGIIGRRKADAEDEEE